MKRFMFVMIATFISTAASAEVFTYNCKSRGKSLSLSINDVNATLRWRGKTYKVSDQRNCARSGWLAKRDGEAFDFCVATQGYADFVERSEQIQCKQR